MAYDLPWMNFKWNIHCLKLSGWHGSHSLFVCQSREIEKLEAIRSDTNSAYYLDYTIYIGYILARWLLYKKERLCLSCLHCLPTHIVLNKYIYHFCILWSSVRWKFEFSANAFSFHSFVPKWQKFANKLLLNFFLGNCFRIVKQLQFHKWN